MREQVAERRVHDMLRRAVEELAIVLSGGEDWRFELDGNGLAFDLALRRDERHARTNLSPKGRGQRDSGCRSWFLTCCSTCLYWARGARPVLRKPTPERP